MLRVSSVAPDSLGSELGLQPGTDLLTINGREIEDFLDWEFLSADEQFLLHVRQPDGEEVEYDVERPEGLPMGVAVEPPRIRRCANRCDFCFVDGLPVGAQLLGQARSEERLIALAAQLERELHWDQQRPPGFGS